MINCSECHQPIELHNNIGLTVGKERLLEDFCSYNCVSIYTKKVSESTESTGGKS